MKRIDVVAGVIARAGRVLLTQRHPRLEFPFKWCTPGGKVEEGETLETALIRELQEEIGIGLESKRAWSGSVIYSARLIASHVYEPPLVARPIALTTYDVSDSVHPRADVEPRRDEVIGYGWFDVSAVEAMRIGELLSPGTRDVFVALLNACVRSGER